jgi:signal transduction histidine kinase/ligand-binding sensor domain-containing protein
MSLFVIALIAVLTCQSAAARTTPAGSSIVHTPWPFKDGAPESPAALAQGSDGYLWVGASSGLYRFDGTRFELFRAPAAEPLQSTFVSALAATDEGLWVGYWFGGFSLVTKGRVRNFVDATGTVNGFAREPQGVVWAGSSDSRPGKSGLWRFDGSAWHNVGAPWSFPLRPVADLGFDADGNLWVLAGRRSGDVAKDLLVLPAGAREFRKAGGELFVRSFTWDADHKVVTARDARPPAGGSLIAWEGPSPRHPLLRKRSLQVLDRAGGVWVLSLDDWVVRDPGGDPLAEVIERDVPEGAPRYEVDANHGATLIDREGSLWLGDAAGMHRLSHSPLVRQAVPPTDMALYLVAQGDGGTLWIVAADGRGKSVLYRVRDGKVDSEHSLAGVSSFAYGAPDGTVWFAGEAGLWHLVGDRFSQVELPPEWAASARFLVSMTHDGSGGYWVSAGTGGLYRLHGGTWTRYQPGRPLPPEEARKSCPGSGALVTFTDRANRLWLGCTKGQLAMLEGATETNFGAQEGVRVGNVTAIHGRGTALWIGGEFGLQRFDRGRFQTIEALDPYALRGISGIVETAEGDLWFNGLGGIVHIPGAELAQAVKDPSYRVSSERFDRRFGLPGAPSQLRRMPTAIEGADGRLWFAVSRGVVWLDPRRRLASLPAPPVSIQSVSADSEAYGLEQPLRFPAGTSSVQIGYAAVSLLRPDAVRFRYRLHGIDDDWHDAGTLTSVSFRSLRPGPYRFEVDASDANGVWSGRTATTPFTIMPAYYQTAWFLALCALLLLLLAWLAYRLRIRRLQRQFEMTLEARVAERTRIARDLHDTLLQSFQGVQFRFQGALMLLPGDPVKARQVLEGAIDQAAQSITEGRDAVQGLRASASEANDLADAIRVLAAELTSEPREPAAPDVRIDVQGTPRALHPIVRDEVFRIADEALRNAARHANAKQVEVEIRYDAREFRLRIRDDGVGIDPRVIEAGGREGHFGLRGMRERAQAVGGTLRLWSALDTGTEVELIIAGPRAYAASLSARSHLAEKLFGKAAPDD